MPSNVNTRTDTSTRVDSRVNADTRTGTGQRTGGNAVEVEGRTRGGGTSGVSNAISNAMRSGASNRSGSGQSSSDAAAAAAQARYAAAAAAAAEEARRRAEEEARRRAEEEAAAERARRRAAEAEARRRAGMEGDARPSVTARHATGLSANTGKSSDARPEASDDDRQAPATRQAATPTVDTQVTSTGNAANQMGTTANQMDPAASQMGTTGTTRGRPESRDVDGLIEDMVRQEMRRRGLDRVVDETIGRSAAEQESDRRQEEYAKRRGRIAQDLAEEAAKPASDYARARHRKNTRDTYRDYFAETNDRIEQDMLSRGLNTESREYRRAIGADENAQGPNGHNPEDRLWEEGYDVTGKEREDWQKVIDAGEGRLHHEEYRRVRERRGDISFDINQSESMFQGKLRQARNAMRRRLTNPSTLHIAGERLESYERNGRTFARRVYSERITYAINEVRDMYDCSVADVLRLVQLRAGLGISYDGTIAGVDPDEFNLTEDQAFELMRDIIASQRENGIPLGPVQGTFAGAGVRDDTGRYVVVAGTRCFPLGYMPNSLVDTLSRNAGSALHGLSERQIHERVADVWLNQTYPQLVANTSGNAMHQARAIENMMRAIMSMDGIDPSDLNIPEVVENRTLIRMAAERQLTTDADIADANEVRHQRERSELQRFLARHRHVTRNADGSIASVGDRRFHGDTLKTFSNLERSAKAANIMVMVSGVPEAIVSRGMQRIGNVLASSHADKSGDYAITDQLRNAASSREAVEALSVAEALYRIGGHTALDAFFAEEGNDGRASNKLTKQDLREFLERMGVTRETVSDDARARFGLRTAGEVKGFLSNVQAMLDGLALGSGMFRDAESRSFIDLSMAEMGRYGRLGGESYTASEVGEWFARGGGEEMVRSLLRTDAGREAFMTQGITSLGRKSPVEHLTRRIMTANGVTEFAIRTMFDRFPEYGINKVMQQIPFCNTLSYLAATGVGSMGDILAMVGTEAGPGAVTNAAVSAGNAMSRMRDYQAGGRLAEQGLAGWAAGLRKNLAYDTVMGGEKLLIAAVYAGAIIAFGGVTPPDDERDRYTWSEWKIGRGDDAMPVKWAWWMDDLSGIGLPLGMAIAICEQGEWSSESKQTATNVFVNAMANLNSGTALFDMIDLVNDPRGEFMAAVGADGGSWYEPSQDEWLMTSLEQGFWGLVGDMTPTFVGQVIPWSKDFIGRTGQDDAHTAARVYDTEGRTKTEAEDEYKTKGTGSYTDYMRRRSTQTNVLYAMFMDWVTGAGDSESDITGYKYTEQPVDTMVDPYASAMYSRFFLDLDPSSTNIPINNQKKREAALDEHAEDVIQWIDGHYSNATQAALDGFVLNYDARVNCINYCHKQINKAWEDYYDAIDGDWLPNDEYRQVVQNRKDAVDHYNNLIYNFLQSDEIGWTLPHYVRQESDMETRYVDEQGNAGTYLGTIGALVDNAALRNALSGTLLGNAIGSSPTTAESYWYGNKGDALPLIRPISSGKGRNYETIPYNVVLDEDGNPVTDVGSMYDNAADMDAISLGRLAGKDVQELMWGGQGTNLKDDVSEELAIERGGIPTLGGSSGSGGGRPWRLLESSVPEALGIGSLTPDQISEKLGIESSAPVDGKYAAQVEHEEEEEEEKSSSSGSKSSGWSWYNSYRGSKRSYSYGSGNSEYNPRIYSNARQVGGDRASGLSVRQPYKATTTYLRPAFYTSGSRTSYRRQQ